MLHYLDERFSHSPLLKYPPEDLEQVTIARAIERPLVNRLARGYYFPDGPSSKAFLQCTGSVVPASKAPLYL